MKREKQSTKEEKGLIFNLWKKVQASMAWEEF